MKQSKTEQYKDRNWLYQKYCTNELSLEKVGELCGVSYNCICEWLKKYQIKRRERWEHLMGKPSWNSSLNSQLDERVLAGNKHGMWGRKHLEQSKIISGRKIKAWYMKNPNFHRREDNPFYGKKHSKESIQKNREANSMEKNANWQGGISFEPYGIEFNNKLKAQIRARDNNQCQMPECGIYENGRCHDIHHIDYCKQNNKPENLTTLCHPCHLQTNYNRNYWMNLFGDKNHV